MTLSNISISENYYLYSKFFFNNLKEISFLFEILPLRGTECVISWTVVGTDARSFIRLSLSKPVFIIWLPQVILYKGLPRVMQENHTRDTHPTVCKRCFTLHGTCLLATVEKKIKEIKNSESFTEDIHLEK